MLISICIPAYKRTDFLQRLLDSITIQTFRDFEVIVTDDSPDGAVNMLCETFRARFSLTYYRNEQPLGTPENWNEGIRKAKGEWIKIMHDDDWFATADALEIFAQTIRDHPEASFVFSAYKDVFLDEDRQREMHISHYRYKALVRNSATLFSRNVIGPPSVVACRRSPDIWYDNKVKWVVDIDFYMRLLQHTVPVYIPAILVNVGLGGQQVTRDCFRQRPVEIPENFYLLNKVGARQLRNILIYDAWWRLMRNLEIRHSYEIAEAGYTGEIPAVILSMVRWQSRIPHSLLKTGAFSKTFMFLHYIIHYNRIPA
ncbi:MAG: glycosyltransferase [Chitinophagaceae bacterium]|nr:glycosyltransferase [Chitinophagaceae bacterium]